MKGNVWKLIAAFALLIFGIYYLYVTSANHGFLPSTFHYNRLITKPPAPPPHFQKIPIRQTERNPWPGLGKPPKPDFIGMLNSAGEHRKAVEEMEAKILKVYDSLNPPSTPGYTNGRTAARLFAYYLGAADPHDEGWLQDAACFALQAWNEGNSDQLLQQLINGYRFYSEGFGDVIQSKAAMRSAIEFADAPYPTATKVQALAGAIFSVRVLYENEISASTFALVRSMQPISARLIGRLVEEKERLSFIRWQASSLIECTRMDNGMRQTIEELIAEELKKTQAPPELGLMLRGAYLIALAWHSRGAGYAHRVSDEGWEGMADYLKKARTLLESASKEYPNNSRFPAMMITVEMGDNGSRERMEEWFNRSISVDSSNTDPYLRKLLFLQPKWHGSVKEVLDFGTSCLATERWADGIPLKFITCIEELASSAPSIYENEKVRKAVTLVYLEYLKHYPKSLRTRTQLLQFAVAMEDWKLAKQQSDLLKNYWDVTVIPWYNFINIQEELEKHP